MKRFVSIALLLIVAASAAAKGTDEKSAKSQHAAGDAALTKAVDDYLGAVSAHNFDKVKSYYASDYTFTDANGAVMTGDQRLAQMRQSPPTVAFSDRSTRSYGSSAIVSGVAAITGGAAASERQRFTQFWVKQGGKWRLAASIVINMQ